jgi:hypothetical protein
MDGIGLELWNKKLLQCRYKRQLEFRANAELSRSTRVYAVEPLPSMLFQAGADNMDLMVLYWRECFQASWLRQKPMEPELAAGEARGEIETLLTTEEKQIDNEVQAVGSSRVLGWKPEDLVDGRAHLHSRVSLLRASCITHIAEARAMREAEIALEENRRESHRKEVWMTRWVLTSFILGGTLIGVWMGAHINARQSKEDRQYVDERIKQVVEYQRRTQNQLSDIHRSNRKIAFWTEKTNNQINQEMNETRERLTGEIQDIREETLRKIARMESEYARSGREIGTDMERRKQGLIKTQDRLIQEAEARAQKRLDALAEQKNNIQR